MASPHRSFLPFRPCPRFLRLCGAGALLAIVLAAPAARAYEVNEALEVYGYMQMWVTLYEQMEDARGLYQHPSGNEATAATTGFSLSRLRVGARATLLRRIIELGLQVKLEDDPGVLDAWLAVKPWRWLGLQLGQFKIPGPYENLIDNRDLDFIERAAISSTMADYQLSRTPHPSSYFSGNRAYLRDLGAALKGEIDIRRGFLRYVLMVGNGLGANLFIGGATNKEFIITNKPQFFYGARLELADLFGIVSLGGHFSYNRHDNIVLQSGRVVYDIDRMSASGDLHVSIPWTGIRLGGLYAHGWVNDDFDGDGRADLTYYGYEARLLWDLTELSRIAGKAPVAGDHTFEVGVRFENTTQMFNESELWAKQNDWTFGMTYMFRKMIKVQVNYVLRRTDDPADPELDDDILFVNIQAGI